MLTPGPVVMDAFRRRFLLVRSRDPQQASSGETRLKKVALCQTEVDRAPHRIEYRDALVAELIGLNATVYEDARQAHAAGLADEVANRGLQLSQATAMRALDELDVMATLLLAQESAPRRAALHVAVGYNLTVGLLEFGRIAEARGHVRALRSELDGIAPGGDDAASIDGFVRAIEQLV